jgi:hypothetical protein
MSGYDPETGIYTLTHKKAQDYHHHSHDDPPPLESMSYYADLLKQAGLNIISVQSDFLQVKASQIQVWQALSDEPSAVEILENPSIPE